MSREAFKDGMVVIHEKTGRKGVVVHDDWGVCSRDEVPIRFDGETGYTGTDWRELCLFDFDDFDA